MIKGQPNKTLSSYLLVCPRSCIGPYWDAATVIAGWAGEENVDPRTEAGFGQVSSRWWVFLLWPGLKMDRYFPVFLAVFSLREQTCTAHVGA